MNFKFICGVLGLFLSNICLGQQTVCTAVDIQQAISNNSQEPIELNIVFRNSQSQVLTTTSTNRDTRRQLVITNLESQAKISQAEVLAILKAEEAKGNVRNIESSWIANTITCQATADVAKLLTERHDISHLGINKEIQLITPENANNIEPKTTSRSGGSILPHISQVNADDVWELGYTGKNIVVAIIDSGTNIDHYDIRNHLWRGYIDTDNDNIPDTWVNGWNFVSNNSNIIDDFKHGSHCAGIVVGDGSSGMRSGVAPDASIMTLKTVNRSGGGTPANMIKAVEFAIKNGADVISISLGFKNSQIDDATKAAIRNTFENTLAAGVVTCAAVGNDGNTYGAPNNVDVPASCPPPYLAPDQKEIAIGGLTSIISVGNVDSNDEYVQNSSCGPSMWDIVIENKYQYNDYPYDGDTKLGLIRPDICAPGEMIISLNHALNNKYTMMSGTSMSTPCVAGVIALMLEKNPDLTPAQICEILENSAKKISESKNNFTGSGRIDALAAINAIEATNNKPYVRLSEYPTHAFIPGNNQELTIKLTNSGQSSWMHTAESDATVTLTINDPYITLAETSKVITSIDAGQTTTLDYLININEDTPNGHVAYFYVTATNGATTYNDKFRIQVNAEAVITCQSFSPSALTKEKNTTLSVTIMNTGNIATTTDSKVILTSNVDGVNIIEGEVFIGPMEVNATQTCNFIVNIDESVNNSDIRFSLQSIPDNYSREVNIISEFEINPEDPVYDDGFCYWTTFDTNSDNFNPLWPFWHSSMAKKNALANVGELLHSGESHMISEAFCSITYISPEYTIPTDNYLVSPKIKASSNSKFSFWARCHQNYTNPGEHFGVAISENSNNIATDFNLIQEWTTEGADWKQYSVDLSQYAGKDIYIAIRHFYSEEEWIAADYGYNYYTLNIDDAKFENVIDASFIYLDKNNNIFRVPISTADIDDIIDIQATVSISVADRQILIENLSGNATIQIFDISGRSILHQQTNSPDVDINTASLQSGIYIVQVNDASGITNCKVKVQ